MSRRKERRIASPTAIRDHKQPWPLLLPAALFFGTLVVYAQVIGFGFLSVDDSSYVTENPHVLQGVTLAGLKWSFTSIHDANWIPLTWISLMLDTQIYGVRPGGYHLTNALLHAASTVLLFAALASATGNRSRSAFVAAMFALHPLHVESVAWIAERKDALSIFFGFASLLAYVQAVASADAGRGRNWVRRSYFFAALLFYVLSLMAKQTLVTLPFVMLLLDYWPLGRFGGRFGPIASAQSSTLNPRTARIASGQTPSFVSTSLHLLLEKAPFFATAAAFSGVAMFAQSHGGAVRALKEYPLAYRCLNGVNVYVLYLWKTIYPQNLAMYYPHSREPMNLLLVGLAAALLLAITVGSIVWIRRCPYLFVGWCWYLGTLVPMIGIVQIGTQRMADRYTYFPLVGVFLAVTWLVPELFPQGFLRTRVLPLASLASIVLFAATTFSQISYWHDSVTLLYHTKESTPDNSVSHEFLGSALINEGNISEGVAELEAAVRLTPYYIPLRCDLAGGLERLGRYDEAEQNLRAALEVDDRNLQALNDLGALLMRRGQLAEAKQQFSKVLAIDHDLDVAHVNLALLSYQTKDFAAAITHAERALELNPNLIACHHYVALSLRGQGRIDEAITHLKRLVEIAPNDVLAKQELADTLAMKQSPRAH